MAEPPQFVVDGLERKAHGFIVAVSEIRESYQLRSAMKIEVHSDDQIVVDAPSPIVLCFVLAVVVGYFIGRTIGIRDRSSGNRE